MRKVSRFSLEELDNFRCRAQLAGRPDREGPEGWSISSVDPMKVVAVFHPHLWVKEGWALNAYHERDRPHGGNAEGFVWAIPEDVPFLDPWDPLVQVGRALYLGTSVYRAKPIPKPQQALDDFREVFEGDGSAWSYALASLLARELVEFGAMWHGCSWSDVELAGETVVVVHDLGVTVSIQTSGGTPIDHYRTDGGYVYSTDRTHYEGSCVIH